MEQSSVRELHQEAMRLADLALDCKRRGDPEAAYINLVAALDFEKRAALSAAQHPNCEPTRSILFRSAASLAIQANLPEEARALIIEGLDGKPPKEIATELQALVRSLSPGHWSGVSRQEPVKQGGKVFKPGDPIPESGIYTVTHTHRMLHEITLIEGQKFPICAKCETAVRFSLRRNLKKEWPSDPDIDRTDYSDRQGHTLHPVQ
jgi:hypothetical protein